MPRDSARGDPDDRTILHYLKGVLKKELKVFSDYIPAMYQSDESRQCKRKEGNNFLE